MPVQVSGGAVSASQIYVAQAGDFPIMIADLFCVPLEDLLDVNGWATASEFTSTGEEISIPPDACAGPDECTVQGAH